MTQKNKLLSLLKKGMYLSKIDIFLKVGSTCATSLISELKKTYDVRKVWCLTKKKKDKPRTRFAKWFLVGEGFVRVF